MSLKLFTLLIICIAPRVICTKLSASIHWKSCPEVNEEIKNSINITTIPLSEFDCASIKVPLDYTDLNSINISLSLFRVNATKTPVLGSVLINFGGPGGTGAENLPIWAAEMAKNIGPQWDLVSWDPRGTGKTLPFVCANASTRSLDLTKRDTGTILPKPDLTEYFERYGWENAGRIADQCYASMNNSGGGFISTASTAHDMIRIVDALGEDGLLRYYGWSYGTALGSYVAAMFPDRVSRIVLDGNLDPHDYQAGHYGRSPADADKAFGAFIHECFQNRQECSLAQYVGANTTDDILNIVRAAMSLLVANAEDEVGWTSYATASDFIYQRLYYPSLWPALADSITQVLNGSYEALDDSTTSSAEPYNIGAAWSLYGIRASDALWHPTKQDYRPQVEFQKKISSFVAGWPSLWVSARWKIIPKYRYEGNFKVRTRHPILYVNGQYDPVTPLVNAFNASKSFEGSVVLQHSGYGHGAVVSPSACLASYVQEYYRSGTLPRPGTVCQPDFGPWEASKQVKG